MTSCCCCYCVSTATLGIIENCGKFSHVGEPGCGCLIPCVRSLRGIVPLGLQIAIVGVDTKTRDNAVVRVETRIHYRVVEERCADAFYKFSNPSEQIGSFASSIVRGEVPKYTLDELFLMSDEIKKVVEAELTDKLLQYGFELEGTLLTRIDPSRDVKRAISQTQVNAYIRTAAEHEAELNKILTIKEAEANFEEKRLSGVGLAQQRKAIMSGLQSSIEEFVKTVPEMRPKDVMNLLLLNQYFDAMKEVGSTGRNDIILLPSVAPHSSLISDAISGTAAAQYDSRGAMTEGFQQKLLRHHPQQRNKNEPTYFTASEYSVTLGNSECSLGQETAPTAKMMN